MDDNLILLICFILAFTSVLITELVKQILKHVCKKKGRQLDMKKLEYPLASMPILLTFVSVFLILYYLTEIPLYDNLKLCATYAAGTQTIYTFVIQLTRKGFNEIKVAIMNFNVKMKDKKSLQENTKDIIDEMKETTDAEVKEEAPKAENFDAWLKDLSKGK